MHVFSLKMAARDSERIRFQTVGSLDAVRRALGGGGGERRRARVASPHFISYVRQVLLYTFIVVATCGSRACRRHVNIYHQLPGKQVPIFMAYNIIDIDNYDLIIV